jgi:hypothetical protein
MNLVFFNPEQDLNIYFYTDFFRFPRTHEEQTTALPKVNVIGKDDACHLEAETPSMTQKDVSNEFQTTYCPSRAIGSRVRKAIKTIIASVNSENKVLSGALESTTRLIREKSLPRWVRAS